MGRVSTWLRTLIDHSGWGVEMAVLWNLYWGLGDEVWILGLAVVCRVCRFHFPVQRCRLATCGLVGASIWRGSSWGMRVVWFAYLWRHPSFPQDISESARPFSKRLVPGATSINMEIDEEAGHSGNLLQISCGEGSVDVQMATLFGEDVSSEELLRQEQSNSRSNPSNSRAPLRHFCPVEGCSRSVSRDTIGFASLSTVRAHVDLHMGGELPRQPPEGWLETQGLAACRCCGLTISRRIRDLRHPRCSIIAPRVPNRHDEILDSHVLTDHRLPTLEDIFLCNVLSKEHLPASLLPLAREEYGKVIARAFQYNVGLALVGGGTIMRCSGNPIGDPPLFRAVLNYAMFAGRG